MLKWTLSMLIHCKMFNNGSPDDSISITIWDTPITATFTAWTKLYLSIHPLLCIPACLDLGLDVINKGNFDLWIGFSNEENFAKVKTWNIFIVVEFLLYKNIDSRLVYIN